MNSSKFSLRKMLLLAAAFFIVSSITAQHSDNGFKKIFDGKTLAGWDGDTTRWHVADGALTAETTKDNLIKTNTFLIWQGGKPGDFELKAKFKISKIGNSGIQYRSEPVDGVPYGLKGYQADIDGENVYTGQNYEERGRGFLAKRGESVVLETGKEPTVSKMIGNPDSLKSVIKEEGWNDLRIVAKGNHITHYINGKLMSEVTDNDTEKRKANGLIGLQAHAGFVMKIQYRDIYIKML